MSGSLDNLSVILVGTRFSGNIGSVARAMKNMGAGQLILVSPLATIDKEAFRMAGRASDVLDQVLIHEDFDQAIRSHHLLIGATSARSRTLDRVPVTPRKAAEEFRPQLAHHRIGLVFGSERSGLTDEHLARCQVLTSVPSSPAHPVLNLSQAVLLCCYEFLMAEAGDGCGMPDQVTQQERQELYRQVEGVLTRIGFLSRSNPQPIMKAVRSFWGGPGMSSRDVRILRGILSQIDWYIQSGHQRDPESILKP